MRVLGKLIVAKGFKKLPKDQKIAKSGHTAVTNPHEKRPGKIPTWLSTNLRDGLVKQIT